MVNSRRVEDYDSIAIIQVNYGVIIWVHVVGCSRWRIRNIGGVVGRDIVTVSIITIIICEVLFSYRVLPPVSSFTYIRVAACHYDDHIIDPVRYWEIHPFRACNKVSSLEV